MRTRTTNTRIVQKCKFTSRHKTKHQISLIYLIEQHSQCCLFKLEIKKNPNPFGPSCTTYLEIQITIKNNVEMYFCMLKQLSYPISHTVFVFQKRIAVLNCY